jgi:hypothetical protein
MVRQLGPGVGGVSGSACRARIACTIPGWLLGQIIPHCVRVLDVSPATPSGSVACGTHAFIALDRAYGRSACPSDQNGAPYQRIWRLRRKVR